MLTIDESIADIRKYLKRLTSTINNNANFTWFKTKYIDKTKIDDIWVCMEASLPDEYKKLIKQKSHPKLKSVALYHLLKSCVRAKSKISASSYAIRHKDALSMIAGFGTVIESDIRFLYNNL